MSVVRVKFQEGNTSFNYPLSLSDIKSKGAVYAPQSSPETRILVSNLSNPRAVLVATPSLPDKLELLKEGHWKYDRFRKLEDVGVQVSFVPLSKISG